MSDLFKDCKDIPLHHSILRNVVDRNVEAKKTLMRIDAMAEMPLKDLSDSATSTGNEDANCIVCL